MEEARRLQQSTLLVERGSTEVDNDGNDDDDDDDDKAIVVVLYFSLVLIANNYTKSRCRCRRRGRHHRPWRHDERRRNIDNGYQRNAPPQYASVSVSAPRVHAQIVRTPQSAQSARYLARTLVPMPSSLSLSTDDATTFHR